MREEPADATPIELPVGVACEKGSESIFLLVIMVVIMIFVVMVVLVVMMVILVVVLVVGVEEVGVGPQFTSFFRSWCIASGVFHVRQLL